MKKSIVFSLLIFFCLFNCTNERSSSQMPAKDGVFIHISHGSEDIHRVLMGLQMATIMAEDHDVLVYFDIKGIEIVLDESEDFTYSHFPSSKTQIDKLLSLNIPVMACPGCLKAAGKEASDLMNGIKIANKEKFFNFTAGRILTIDY